MQNGVVSSSVWTTEMASDSVVQGMLISSIHVYSEEEEEEEEEELKGT